MKYRTILIAFIVILSSGLLSAKRIERKAPLIISLDFHEYSLPFTEFIKTPVQPGATIGTEFTYTEGRIGKLLQTANIGLYHNRYFGTGISLSTDFGYRHTTPFGLFFDTLIGIGCLHRINKRQIYQLTDDGTYQKTTDFGRPTFRFGGSVSIGYIFRRTKSPIRIFTRYTWFANTPYQGTTIPLMGHSLVQFGFGFHFNTRSKEQ